MSLPVGFVYSDIMASASDGSMRAHVDVDAGLYGAMPAEAPLLTWDPQACPAAWLPICAFNYSVKLWEDTWSEQTLRDWIEGNWSFIRQIGTPPAFATALAPSGYRVVDMVRPPQGFYAVETQTKEEQDAWIKLMPEIRITFGPRVGGPDYTFFVGDFIPDPDDPEDIYGAIGFNDGPSLIGRFGVLRKNGVDIPLANAVETKVYTPGQRRFNLSMSTEGRSDYAIFVNDCYVDDDNRFIQADQDEPQYINTIIEEDYSDETSVFALDFITPGLDPLTTHWGLDSDVGDGYGAVFVDDYFIDEPERYALENDAPYMIAQTLRLLDPSVVASVNAFGSFIGDRIGLDLRTMEIMVDLDMKAGVNDPFVGASFIGEIFAVETDTSDFERAFRAIEAARGHGDRVLVSFESMRPLQVRDPVTAATTAGEWVPNSL